MSSKILLVLLKVLHKCLLRRLLCVQFAFKYPHFPLFLCLLEGIHIFRNGKCIDIYYVYVSLLAVGIKPMLPFFFFYILIDKVYQLLSSNPLFFGCKEQLSHPSHFDLPQKTTPLSPKPVMCHICNGTW